MLRSEKIENKCTKKYKIICFKIIQVMHVTGAVTVLKLMLCLFIIPNCVFFKAESLPLEIIP